MSNYKYIQSCGLAIEVVEGKLRLSPADKVTEDIVEFVRQNRSDIIDEITAINLLNWYQSIRHTRNPDEDIYGYSSGKVHEAMDYIDAVLSLETERQAKYYDGLIFNIEAIKRHLEIKV